MNVMMEVIIDKVTANIGVGAPGDRLEYAKELLNRLTKSKAIETTAKRREPVFKLRKGLPIGTKVTLRGKRAAEFLDKALTANRRLLKAENFDKLGNFAFGVAEYIDFPGAKYNPEAGMFGFDVCVTLKRRGERVCRRKIMRSKIGKKHRITKEEAIQFVREKLNAKIE
jgi:large subunit ribosomal protein L5